MTEQPGREQSGEDRQAGQSPQPAQQQPTPWNPVQVSGEPGSWNDGGPIQWRSGGNDAGAGERPQGDTCPEPSGANGSQQGPDAHSVPPRSIPQQPGAQPQQPGPQTNTPQYQEGRQLPEYWTQYTQYQNTYNQFQNDPDYLRLKTVRTQITVANVCGPVSLLIGGVALSTVGIVCAVLAWRGAKHVASSNSPSAPMANNFRKSALVSIVICCVAFALNAFYAAMIMPAMLEAVNTGDFSQLLGSEPSGGAGAGAEGSTGSGDGGSAWG